MSHSIVAQRDLRPRVSLHSPLQGMAVLTLFGAESEGPEAGPVLRLRAGGCVRRTLGSGHGPAKAGRSLFCAYCSVARFQEPMAPDSAPAKSGGVSSI